MIAEYLKQVATRYKTGISREHSYRGDLQHLLQALNPGILVTNEPARIACGAPDYILTKSDIPLGYIEAKDIGVSLDKTAKSEQLQRYLASLDNLILTDYLEFRYYKHGQFLTSVTLAEIQQGKITPISENFEAFTQLIHDFCTHTGQQITSASKLAGMMAGKAKMLQTVIEQALLSDDANEENSSLKDQMSAFQRILIHDIQASEFADIYAQTIAYGMFAARLNDPSLETFSRREAAELIPKTNPFLRKLFSYIAGIDIDDRITWIVDALADVFRATDVAKLLENFGKVTQMNDPIIHFYETFLAEYNPKLRKSRGVWYTPESVVNFIVRAVDDILKTEFGLSQGLADTSKTTIEVDTQIPDKRSKTGYKREKQELHKVQILDPAAGTGTFLAAVIKHVHQKFQGQEGLWSKYVEDHLIPRLHGFEILMASYAMAHLKLDLLLRETGYVPKTQQRFRVFLTNSLEEAHPDTGTLFASWLSREATEANYIKRDTPVMVVLGNPPYSVSSSNKGEWIQSLLNDYKKDLNERNINPLSDDYIKFIRYGQYFIEKNGEGILAYISNNSFIDGIIHRKMREKLLDTFDRIYILDLHGNVNRKESAHDGSKDENVFDIQQGVSINIFVKTSRHSKKLSTVLHLDSYGKRQGKYELLNSNTIDSLEWQTITPKAPEFFFVPKDYETQRKYECGLSINKLFNLASTGIKTHRDNFVIDFDSQTLKGRIQKFYDESFTDEEIRKSFQLKDNRDWRLAEARRTSTFDASKVASILYRPFDVRPIYYEYHLIDFGRENVMKHILNEKNIGLIVSRQAITNNWSHVQVTDTLFDNRAHYSNKGIPIVCPLYLYSESERQQTLNIFQERKPNLNIDIVRQIAQKISAQFISEEADTKGTFTPIDIFDYIYGVLHSPSYREIYKESLKIDFPRVPYPKNADTFWQLVKLGGELRQIHLLESPKVEQYITAYPQDGNNTIIRKINQKDYELHESQEIGRVWINDTQYFDKVPKVAWEFYIGGYQPAQKWLKDRHNRELSFEDILHYQKIIVALTETDRIMKEIDAVNFME